MSWNRRCHPVWQLWHCACRPHVTVQQLNIKFKFPSIKPSVHNFFSCPVLLFLKIFYHLHYFIISVFILYFLGVCSSHPLWVCVCSFGHFLFYSAVSFLMCPVGLLLVFTHCCDLLLFPNCFHQLGSTCVFSLCLTSVLSVCSAPMFFPYVLHSMPFSTLSLLFVKFLYIFSVFLIFFYNVSLPVCYLFFFFAVVC